MEFEKLHQFLRDEEAARIAALKQEEEEKSQRMKRKIDETDHKIARLQDIIRKTEKELDVEDVALLQVRIPGYETAPRASLDPPWLKVSE